MWKIQPYLVLLVLDWAIDMGGIINLKKRGRVFKNEGTRVIVLLDPVEGERYTKLVKEEEDVDHIYNFTTRYEYWINPTTDGMLFWEKDNEFFSDSDGEMENWQNQLHDVSVLRCPRIIKNF